MTIVPHLAMLLAVAMTLYPLETTAATPAAPTPAAPANAKRSLIREENEDARKSRASPSPSPFRYINPRPEASLVSPYTTVSLRVGGIGDSATLSLANVERGASDGPGMTVHGSESGGCDGSVKLVEGGSMVIFEPSSPFAAGETVTVHVKPGLRVKEANEAVTVLEGYTWRFTVSPKESGDKLRRLTEQPQPTYQQHQQQASSAEKAAATQSFISPPSSFITLPSDFPLVNVTVPAKRGATAEGYIFAANIILRTLVEGDNATAPGFAPYLLILDDSGEPVFHRRLERQDHPQRIGHADFTVQQRTGHLTYFDERRLLYVELDKSYTEVKTHRPGHGYEAELHGIHLREDGHVLLMAYDIQPVDLQPHEAAMKEHGLPLEELPSIWGESTTKTLAGAIVQELDAEGNVVYEWRSWDGIKLPDALFHTRNTYTIAAQQFPFWDLAHVNSVDWSSDGHIIMSLRMLGVVKVSRDTGTILWRLGGKEGFNDFIFINQSRPFSFQHDVRLLTQDNGTLLLTMYDNGPRDVPEYSRAVSYRVDEAAMTATQVWEYRHSPDLYTWATGSSQLLDNGNYAIDWGGIGKPLMPFYTEIDPQTSSKVLEMQFVHGSSYRATRHRWQGEPAEPPTLMVANQDNGSGHGSTAVATSPSLHFSWNGATGVVGWEVLVGEREGAPMTVTRQVEKKHFEDGVSTSELVDLVEAVRNSVEESEGSAAECCVWQVVPLMADGTKGKPSNTVTIRST